MLVFTAEETHLERILNFNFVSAEILRTLAGSMGMVLVAPVTALAASLLFHHLHGPSSSAEEEP
jgi:uncharacterized membrane protein